MSDHLLRALAQGAGIQIIAACSTALTERARTIHQTLPVATAALGRTLTATAMMGNQLKSEQGSITVQIKGNGPLGAIVCVGDAEGYVRGYLQNPQCDLPKRADGKLDVGGGVGRGYLMVIKDIGMREPVTGTTALVSGEIAEDLTRYFAQSEQIPSACALGVLVNTDCSVQCAGGYLVQLMPGVRDADIDRLEQNLAKIPSMTTMLRSGKTLEQIIEAVLEGFAVEFFDKQPIGYRCGCSEEKVTRALISMGRDELIAMAQDTQKNEVTCQFCDKVYAFSSQQLQDLLRQAQS